MTAFLSVLGWCLFGLAAVLLTVFLLRALKRVDRVLSLAEANAIKFLTRR